MASVPQIQETGEEYTMSGVKLCRVCGVPRSFAKDYKWNNDGTATMSIDPDLRNVFCECEGIDRLFRNINILLGTDISHIIAEGKRKFSYDYLSDMLSSLKGIVVRALLRRKVYQMISEISPITGYGAYELLDYRRGEYVKVRGRNVYSLPLLLGDLQAVFEVVEGIPANVSLTQEGDAHILEITPSGDSEKLELKSRLALSPHARKPGGIEYHRCPECGLPLDFREFTWDFEAGVITDSKTGRNMALIGLESLQAVFLELESELGEDIPTNIQEAYRRYVRDVVTREELGDEEDYLPRQLALKGMGNVVKQTIGAEGMEVRVENGSPPPVVAGLMQGVFEILKGRDSDCEYGVDGEGTLEVSVKAR